MRTWLFREGGIVRTVSLGDGTARERVDAARNELGPAPHTGVAEPSTIAPKILTVAAGKHPVSDIIANDRSRKKVRAIHNVGIPPALTPEKRERTFLFVLLPCSSSEMVLVKLRSTMTLPALFSSVCAAAGIIEHERLAIAVIFEREGSGHGKTIILRRNSKDAFEYFLMVIDVATRGRKKAGGCCFFYLLLKFSHYN